MIDGCDSGAAAFGTQIDVDVAGDQDAHGQRVSARGA